MFTISCSRLHSMLFCITVSAAACVLTPNIIAFGGPVLSDEIAAELKQKHPDCTVEMPAQLTGYRQLRSLRMESKWKCTKDRIVTLTVNLPTSIEEKDQLLRSFHLRSIMPPSKQIEGLGTHTSMYTMNGRIEFQFQKYNMVYRIDMDFPMNKKLKGPHYDYPAPANEEKAAINYAKTIESAGTGDRYVSPCDTNFAWQDLNYGVSSEERLFSAIKQGNHALAVMFIGLGTNLEADIGDFVPRYTNSEKHKPIHLAVEQGCLDTVAALVAAGANINSLTARNETPLMLAVSTLNSKIVDYLLEKGARSDAVSTYGYSVPFFVFEPRPVLIAWDSDKERLLDALTIFGMLKKSGVDLRAPESLTKNTLLNLLYNGCGGTEFCTGLTEFLLDEGVDINAPDSRGFTPIYKAVTKMDITHSRGAVEQLLAAGADPSIVGRDGETIVGFLSTKKEDKMIEENKRRLYSELLEVVTKSKKNP